MNKPTAFPTWRRNALASFETYLLLKSQRSLRLSLPPGLLATIYGWMQ